MGLELQISCLPSNLCLLLYSQELSILHSSDTPGSSGTLHESLLWTAPGPGLPWQVAAPPHGAALCPSRKCPHPKRIICIWKPLIRLHAWLRHHPHSSPLCCGPGQGAKPPRDLLLEPQTTLCPSTGRKQGLQPRRAGWGRRRGTGCWQVALAPLAAGVSPTQHRNLPWALSPAAHQAPGLPRALTAGTPSWEQWSLDPITQG